MPTRQAPNNDLYLFPTSHPPIGSVNSHLSQDTLTSKPISFYPREIFTRFRIRTTVPFSSNDTSSMSALMR